jgi:hypothetical protein
VWSAVRVNPNSPTGRPALYTPPSQTLTALGLTGCMGHRLCGSLERGLSRALMRVGPDSGSWPGFLQGNWPTTVSAFLFPILISLQYKF